MQIGILGSLTVVGADGPVAVGGARLRTLLLRLAVDVGATVHADRLVDALWGDQVPADQANALQSLVSRLRRVLIEPVLQSTPTGYRLVLGADDLDAARFERLAREGRAALERGAPTDAATLLDEALALWRGRPFEDLGDAPFATAAVTRLEELRLAATEDRLDARLALGRADAAVAEVESLAAAHPLRERLRALQVRALGAAGRQADALSAYDDIRRRLADELGVDPSPALQEAQLAVLRGETAAPAPRSVPTNLRASLTTFVGRDADTSAVRRLLDRARLVTLVGPGGAGKTRLAVETAAQLARGGALEDGVWLVELAPVTDPDDIAQAVLGSLTLRETRLLDNRAPTGPRDALDRLVDAFGGGPALLVLDNCEHLVEGAARLADHLLGRCPDLRVLATSREPLAILGESVYPVPPLGQPAPDASAEAALSYPAVRLLVDRAGSVRPGFTVDDGNVADVVEIVRRLDGLPLAIELAAARLRVLSVHQVAERLEDRFRLLTGGSRTAMPRHQTLRAVVAWSWDLLTDDERRLAELLAVFSGGADLDAVQQVAGDDDGRDVLDVLTALSDKSLVQTTGDSEPRYRMLETIREYGVERLAERGAVPAARRAHAAYYVTLAERAESQLRGADQVAWLDRLGAERDNVLAALRFAADTGDAETAVRLGAAMGWYWMLLGSHAEAYSWLGVALDTPGELAPQTRPVRQLAALEHLVSGYASGQLGADLTAARALLEGELADVEGTDGHPLLAIVGPGAAMLDDDVETARERIARNLQHPDPWARAALTMMRGGIAENAGDIPRLRLDAQDGFDQFAALGDRWGMATCLTSLAWVRMIDGDLDGSIAAYERSIQLVTELRASDDVTEQLLRLASVRLRQGDVEGARRDITRAREIAERRHSLFTQAFVWFGEAELARYEGDLARARALGEEALGRISEAPTGPAPMLAILSAGFALVELAEGDHDAARQRLEAAIGGAFAVRDMPIAAMALVGFARLARALGDAARAATLLGAALKLRGAEDRSDREAAEVAEWARAALGLRGYDAAHARGLAFGREEARAFALGEDPGPGDAGEVAVAAQARRR